MASEDSTRTIDPESQGISTLKLDGAIIEVVEGPAVGDNHRMRRANVCVGSGDDADFRVADNKMSRRHFELLATREGILLRDLDSRNGTFVQGCRVREGTIYTRTEIIAGKSRLVVRPAKSMLSLEVSRATVFGDAIGESVAMRHVFATLARAATTNATVLLAGESGTGKEVLAQALHSHSPRARGPFVVVDCAALAENLVESELFGHERGSFTGAFAQHVGAFERASGGTLFLDELGELPLSQQVKLLRVLESRRIQRVGSSTVTPVDVRIVAATNVDLEEAVRKGRFREDLYYRLSVLRVDIPPLRDRPEDLAPLAHLFYQRLAGTKDDVPLHMLELLRKHSWPGNVRELRNAIERWIALGSATPEELLGSVRRCDASGVDPSQPYHEAKRRALEAFDRAYLPAVLSRADGVVSKAAELAGVPRTSFHRMLARARGEE